MSVRDKILMLLPFVLAAACFAAAIFGPILWPDLAATTTVTTVVPGCDASYEVADD